MAEEKVTEELDNSTERKILNAARMVFHKKGYAATRTRDIAEEAGINLELLNYYFRSKEKLFEIVMMETMQGFFKSISEVFNNPATTLEEKLEKLPEVYIDKLLENPFIPLFVVNVLHSRPDDLMQRLKMKEMWISSSFMSQLKEGVRTGKYRHMHPMHLVMNMMGMMLFPFIGQPIVKGLGNMSNEDFTDFMNERKKLIPVWLKSILKPE